MDKNGRPPNGLSLEAAPTWSASPWTEKGGVRHTWDLVKKRYADTPEVLEAFEGWAAAVEIPETGVTISGWLAGEELERQRLLPRRRAPSELQVTAAVTGLRKPDAFPLSEKVREVKNAPETGPLSEGSIKAAVDEAAAFLPAELARSMSGVRVLVVPPDKMKNGADATYLQGVLKLNENMQNDRDKLKVALAHEVTHWLWPRLPAASRAKLRDHLKRHGEGANWINEHVGSRADGSELLAYYFETFFLSPAAMTNVAAQRLHRETLNLIAEVLS